APTPYDSVGLQDHNRVLKADVTPDPELTNSIVRPMRGPARVVAPTGPGRQFGSHQTALALF
ncbi:hypothetical protein ACPCK8_09455, partial [Streptomyces cellulosae]